MRDRDTVAEPHHASGRDEIAAAAGAQEIDMQVDGADARKMAVLRVLAALPEYGEMDREAGRDVEHGRDHAAVQDLPPRVADQVRAHVETQLRGGRIERLDFQPEHAVERHAVLEYMADLGFQLREALHHARHPFTMRAPARSEAGLAKPAHRRSRVWPLPAWGRAPSMHAPSSWLREPRAPCRLRSCRRPSR